MGYGEIVKDFIKLCVLIRIAFSSLRTWLLGGKKTIRTKN